MKQKKNTQKKRKNQTVTKALGFTKKEQEEELKRQLEIMRKSETKVQEMKKIFKKPRNKTMLKINTYVTAREIMKQERLICAIFRGLREDLERMMKHEKMPTMPKRNKKKTKTRSNNKQ